MIIITLLARRRINIFFIMKSFIQTCSVESKIAGTDAEHLGTLAPGLFIPERTLDLYIYIYV